jgi:hypothetical protein
LSLLLTKLLCWTASLLATFLHCRPFTTASFSTLSTFHHCFIFDTDFLARVFSYYNPGLTQ